MYAKLIIGIAVLSAAMFIVAQLVVEQIEQLVSTLPF